MQSPGQTAQLYLSLRSWSNSVWSDFVPQNTPTEPGPASAAVTLEPSNPDPRGTDKSLPSHWFLNMSVTVGG